MKAALACLLFALLCLAAGAQSLAGTVKSARPAELELNTPAGTQLLFADEQTTVWRGRDYHDFSVLHIGDEVFVRLRVDASSRPVVDKLWANLDRITGRIVSVSNRRFEVDQNFDIDPHSGYKRARRDIVFDKETEWHESAAADLRVGRTVDVIGLKLDSARVQATRVTVIEGRGPVRMRPGRVMLPNGQIVTQ